MLYDYAPDDNKKIIKIKAKFRNEEKHIHELSFLFC